ncbi:hypothetical protein C8Q78DRAFT_498501 [Trametes maxima]|nr:hypothetical protein C8Q78DRAFT_498501 [Trametes maxima]
MSTLAQDHRLPTNVTPNHYDLHIFTDSENSTFGGIVQIDLRVHKDTSKIVLNTLDLQLKEITIHSRELNEVLKASDRVFDRITQRGTFTFPKILPAGSHARLVISFEGGLTGNLSGYYISTGGKDGEIVYSLTQFQPTSARKAFPCWDEPALKATFAITMISLAGGVNLSNMPARSEHSYSPDLFEKDSWITTKLASVPDPSNWKITRFETTPPISTYLVAYANGAFEYLESTYKSPLSGVIRPLRIYATEDNISQGQYALDIMQKIMPLYEEIFDLEYPLPKLDILVSADFDLGGMENWGLIVGRTQCFLHDPESDDLHNNQYVASMVSHEVGHMWFGDITTMEWWDNLYLNEGFATLVGEKIILDRLFPEWQLDAFFLGANFYQARSLDARLSSHPIEVECPDANKIIQIFDSLSYSKAASVLRMLANYVGEDKFLEGVSLYLKKHKYKNTVTQDLWEGIQTATNQDIPGVMDNWVKKMGYPVITVTEKEGGIHLRQDRFLETGPAELKDNETIWTIPLNLLTEEVDGAVRIDSEILLAEREKFVPLDIGKVFKLNAAVTGFYVVQYSAERLVKLGQQAASSDSPFSLQDRIGLVRDAFALCTAGYSSVSSALGLVDALRSTHEYLVWDAIANSLSFVAWTWWEYDDVVGPLNVFRRSLFAPIAKRLGFEKAPYESSEQQQLRTKAIEQAANAGDPWVIEEFKSRFAHFVQTGDDSKIPSSLTSIAYRIGVQEGGAAEWEFVKGLAVSHKTPAQGLAAMIAMGYSRDLTHAAATFRYVLEEAREQDVLYYLRGLQRNVVTRRFLAETVFEHFDEVEKRYAGTFVFNNWLDVAFGGLSSDEDYQRISAFFQDKDTATYELALRQTLDTIHSRAQWIKRSTEELTHWLKEHSA